MHLVRRANPTPLHKTFACVLFITGTTPSYVPAVEIDRSSIGMLQPDV